MFRLSNCLLLGGVSALTDETSLMQGLKPPVQDKHRQDKAAVANLLESAKGMLKNGETADVVAFAQATLAEIAEGVIPAIEDGHRVEQNLLNDHFQFFEDASLALNQAMTNINREGEGMRDLAASARESHMTCRNDEERLCGIKTTCDYDLFTLWRDFAQEEQSLRSIENRFQGHEYSDRSLHGHHFTFCHGNGTTFDFRRDAVPIMEEFKTQWPNVVTAESLYDSKQPQCETHYTNLDTKTAQCEADQDNAESMSCAHRHAVITARATFTCDWSRALENYDRTEKEARLMMIDRIREFRMLSTVQCLLDRTTERNGRPCDETTPELDNEIANCEDTHRTVDISHLILEFPCEMRQCANGQEGTGPSLNDDGSTNPGCSGQLLCPAPPTLPRVPESPCQAGQIYPGLPRVPQPDFFWDSEDSKNSHCNQRELCEGCPEIAPALCVIPGWEWDSDSYRHAEVTYPGQ